MASWVGVTITLTSLRRESEGPAFEPAEVQGEPVAHPGEDLRCPAAFLKVTIGAIERMPRLFHRRREVNHRRPSTSTAKGCADAEVSMKPCPRSKADGVGGTAQRKPYHDTGGQHDFGHRLGDDPKRDERGRFRLGRFGGQDRPSGQSWIGSGSDRGRRR